MARLRTYLITCVFVVTAVSTKSSFSGKSVECRVCIVHFTFCLYCVCILYNHSSSVRQLRSVACCFHVVVQCSKL